MPALLLVPLASFAAGATKPSVAFMIADEREWGDVSCHGAEEWLKTPTSTGASEGLDFQPFNVLSPVCSPSRVSATTGCYSYRFYGTQPQRLVLVVNDTFEAPHRSTSPPPIRGRS